MAVAASGPVVIAVRIGAVVLALRAATVAVTGIEGVAAPWGPAVTAGGKAVPRGGR